MSTQALELAGFDFADPLAPIAEQTGAGAADEHAQIAIASNDVRCKIETNLVGIGAAVQAAYDQQYIDRHRDALERRQSEIDAYLRRAAAKS